MYTPVYGNSALHRHSKDTLLPLRQGKGLLLNNKRSAAPYVIASNQAAAQQHPCVKEIFCVCKTSSPTIQWLHAIATNAQVSGFTCLALNWRQGQNVLGCAHHDAEKKTRGESQVNLMPHVKLFVYLGSWSLNSQMDCCLLGTKPSVTTMLIFDWSIEGFGLFQYCDTILPDIKIPIIKIRRSSQSYLYNGNAVPIYIETGPINYLCCFTISIEPSICQLHPPIK